MLNNHFQAITVLLNFSAKIFMWNKEPHELPFQDGRNVMSSSQNKCHLHTRTVLSKPLNVKSFDCRHFPVILIPPFLAPLSLGAKRNFKSLASCIDKWLQGFLTKRRSSCLEGSNFPDAHRKQKDMHLERDITSKAKQEAKLRSKNGSLFSEGRENWQSQR